MKKRDINDLLQEYGDKAADHLDTISMEELDARIKAIEVNGHDAAPDAWRRDTEYEQPAQASVVPFSTLGATARADCAEPSGKGAGKFDPRFTFTSAAALEYVLDEINLIQDLLPASGLAAFYGPPGCGKSFGAIDVAIHLGAGIPFASKRTERAHVIYIVAEGGRRFRNRVKRAMEKVGVEPENVALDLIHAAPNLGLGPDDAGELILAIKAQQNTDFADLPLVVIVDTLSRTMGGAKEDDAGIGMFVANCGHIEKELHGLVIAIHHTGKDEAQGMRGWSGMHAACDCEWLFAETDKGHSVTIKKFRDEPSKITWDFTLEQVEIGRNRYDEPVTTCVVDIASAPRLSENAKAKPKDKPLKGAKAQVLSAIKKAIANSGENAPASNHIPNNVRVVTRDAFARYYDKMMGAKGRNLETVKRERNREITALAGDGHIGVWGDFIWQI
jgi:hypothetical protein